MQQARPADLTTISEMQKLAAKVKTARINYSRNRSGSAILQMLTKKQQNGE